MSLMIARTSRGNRTTTSYLLTKYIYYMGALYVRSVQIIYKINIKAVRSAWLVGSPSTYCLYSDYTYTYKYSGEVFTLVCYHLYPSNYLNI